MKKPAIKLVASFLLMVLSVVGLRVSHFDGFFFAFLVGFVLTLLYSIDLGHQARDSDDPSLFRRTIGIALGIPEAIFGLISIAVGGAVIAWVLYNTFVERLPEYSGGILSLGFGPAFVVLGAFWLISAFRRSPPRTDADDADDADDEAL